ncbi:hypothetical protein F5B20DRAFT_171054 [Whalleya microplaca]|nr:hypothetical protein F5B20DRAFT_171054 [Whalleya microplaca]
MPRILQLLNPHRKKSTLASTNAEGNLSSTSVRSLEAFEEDDDTEEGGAYIPDIPRRRLSRRSSIAEYIASPTTVRLWPARASSVSIERRKGRKKAQQSSQNNSDPVPTEPATMSPDSGDTQDGDTRSSSMAPRSLLSRSTKSEENSSTSSLVPVHGAALPGLQSKGPTEYDGLEPLAEEEFDPASFDLVAPANGPAPLYSLEARSEALFSVDHLRGIFDDPTLLQRFTNFLYVYRPSSVPLLVYYLDASKALKAINYANSITKALAPIKGLHFSNESVADTINRSLVEKTERAFELLAREDLPAYITHIWIRTVSVTIKKRISDVLPVHLRELSEGLAEVFCMTDPSRHDNPLVFASEEFYKTTQYGMGYVLGRNCRLLQGPKTNPSSVRRIREKLEAGKEHCEVFLNYRRDGSPFMNLLMVAPLYDSRGVVRYHIGAQVDVSGLAKECAGLESLERLVGIEGERDKLGSQEGEDSGARDNAIKDEFRELAQMFNPHELKTVRKSGGLMLHAHQEETVDAEGRANWHKPRLLIKDDAALDRPDSSTMLQISASSGGRLSGVYEHYLLVRPHPNLRILFASPSLRVPGMLQSNFMSRIGGSPDVRSAIARAFADGNGVTAKVRWISSSSRSEAAAADSSKGRWIHATPLLGSTGAVGVWMVVLVDDEAEAALRRARDAPPVASNIGSVRKQPKVAVAAVDEDKMSLGSFAEAHRDADADADADAEGKTEPGVNGQKQEAETETQKETDKETDKEQKETEEEKENGNDMDKESENEMGSLCANAGSKSARSTTSTDHDEDPVPAKNKEED